MQTNIFAIGITNDQSGFCLHFSPDIYCLCTRDDLVILALMNELFLILVIDVLSKSLQLGDSVISSLIPLPLPTRECGHVLQAAVSVLSCSLSSLSENVTCDGVTSLFGVDDL